MVPPLRERADDILPLAEHYLKEQSPGLVSDDLKGKLKTYPWPGNVRELRNVVVRAAVFASGEQIETSDLPEEIQPHRLRQGSAQPRVFAGPGARGDYAGAPGKAGSPAKAAECLGISRRTLQRKIKSYGLTTERAVSIAG